MINSWLKSQYWIRFSEGYIWNLWYISKKNSKTVSQESNGGKKWAKANTSFCIFRIPFRQLSDFPLSILFARFSTAGKTAIPKKDCQSSPEREKKYINWWSAIVAVRARIRKGSHSNDSSALLYISRIAIEKWPFWHSGRECRFGRGGTFAYILSWVEWGKLVSQFKREVFGFFARSIGSVYQKKAPSKIPLSTASKNRWKKLAEILHIDSWWLEQ